MITIIFSADDLNKIRLQGQSELSPEVVDWCKTNLFSTGAWWPVIKVQGGTPYLDFATPDDAAEFRKHWL